MTALPRTLEETVPYALEVLKTGSGANATTPLRLGPVSLFLSAATETACITFLFGKKDLDWFDAGRQYHKDPNVCEQLVRVTEKRRREINLPPVLNGIYSVFFDISELNQKAPVDEKLRQKAIAASGNARVPDVTLVSRFPLTLVKATDAKEAARIVAGYLAQAQSDGWKIGSARALVDGWRNEYALSKGGEETVMRFDMRPALLTDSRLNLVALTLIAGTPKLEEVIMNFDSIESWPEAFAAAGMAFVDTSETKGQVFGKSIPKERAAPDIWCHNGQIIWNKEALERLASVNTKLLGRSSTLELGAADFVTLLTVAKSISWEGASHLFQTGLSASYRVEIIGFTQATGRRRVMSLSMALPRLPHCRPRCARAEVCFQKSGVRPFRNNFGGG